MKTAIFIPTLSRPHKLADVVANIKAGTPEEHEIYFICESSDTLSQEIASTLDCKVLINREEPCYAGAINTAYKETEEPYFFTGADDLNFHPGWLTAALAHMSDQIQVIGTNDMGDIPIGPQRDSTHYLIARRYIKEQSGRIDCPNTVLYPYDHNYTDKEFIETAKKRGVFEYAPESEVEHMHWAWNKNQMDDTYKRGFSSNEMDRQIYERRRSLWQ